jgi:hypothetical protein
MRYGNNKGLGSSEIRYGKEKGAFVPKRRNKERLKVHKNENFFCFDFEFCTISLLVMIK